MSDNRLFFDRKPVETITELIGQFGSKEFKSPFRSTIPLISIIKDDFGAFRELLPANCRTSHVDIYFEWKTPSKKGRGNESQTDAMVFCSDAAIATEAKWTEGRYETLSDRLNRKPLDEELLDGWLEHIRPYVTSPISISKLADIPYQMIHRAASACAAAAERKLRPVMIYLHFHETQSSHGCDTYFKDLSDLHRMLGYPSELEFILADVPLLPTASFEQLRGLRKGSGTTADLVIPALRDSRLFEFGEPIFRRIGDAISTH